MELQLPVEYPKALFGSTHPSISNTADGLITCRYHTFLWYVIHLRVVGRAAVVYLCVSPTVESRVCLREVYHGHCPGRRVRDNRRGNACLSLCRILEIRDEMHGRRAIVMSYKRRCTSCDLWN